ncbi:CPBP family intramembrane glutamic endopeptidase [Salsipaludibacter albus]|uniref:CPBP family intramembrane glutamic endopeptidase n=1 Tax=Salsipaludibacter albus TaxID=2849650 RepID=UPI001EE497CB|nr:type II CAAX endopeptidase family protein [Salsipaludibacter albus]MBY5162136.1 CPBP family intramembrane metalloprotease [Salsipaludibacter albus]
MGTANSTGLRPPATLRHTTLGRTRALMQARPLLVFAVLACALSWWTVPFTGFPLGSGVTVAAVVMLAIVEGRSGVVDLFRRVVQWKVGWKWFAAALGVPIIATGISGLLAVAFGAAVPDATALATWGEIPVTILFLLVVPVFGPWEEPGFRGWALSTAGRRWSLWRAGLLVGVIQLLWHLPLFLTGDILSTDVILILAASFVFAWLVDGTGGSVLVAMVMHATNNAVSGEYASTLFTGQDAELLGWIRAGVWCLIALAIVVLSRRRREAVSRS